MAQLSHLLGLLLFTIIIRTTKSVSSTEDYQQYLEKWVHDYVGNIDFFNAAYGSRFYLQEGTTEEDIVCTEGNYPCVKPWRSENNELVTNQNNTGNETENCSDLQCHHECPTPQYSKPEPVPMTLVGENCLASGLRDVYNSTPVESVTLPAGGCASLTFVSGFSEDDAQFRFDIMPNFDVMSSFRNKFLLLEGELSGNLVSSGAPGVFLQTKSSFYWTLRRGDLNWELSLDVPVGNDTAFSLESRYSQAVTDRENIGIVVEHINTAPGSLCFYVNGVKKICHHELLPDNATPRILQRLGLYHDNPVRLPVMIGRIGQMHSYIASPSLLSAREVFLLYHKADDVPDFLIPDPQCQCQQPAALSHIRSDWSIFDDDFIVPGECVYSGLQATDQLMSAVPRVNDNSHSFAMAIDGNVTTSWLTGLHVDSVKFRLDFGHKVELRGISLIMTNPPEVLQISTSSGENISSIRLTCAGISNCHTWDEIINTAASNNTNIFYPVFSWAVQPTTVQELLFSMEGLPRENNRLPAFVINELTLISTCYCANGDSCNISSTQDVQKSEFSYTCKCNAAFNGLSCDECSAGHFTFNTDSSHCKECVCERFGTCLIDSSGKCQHVNDTCDTMTGRCHCRRAELADVVYDTSCTAAVWEITPDHGPEAGGTLVEIKGTLIAAYTRVRIAGVTRKSTPILEDGEFVEKLRFLTPGGTIGREKINLGVPSFNGRSTYDMQESSLNRISFNILPNPKITSIQSRNISASGGVFVSVKGKNLNSSASPKMMTHVICASSDQLFDTVQSECVHANLTTLTCQAPDLSDVLQRERCSLHSSGKRKKRSMENIVVRFGFQFDGYIQYKSIDTSVNISAGGLVSLDPILHNFTEAEGIRKVPQDLTRLTIKGLHLTACCTEADYKVSLGTFDCMVERLSDNQLYCKISDDYRLREIDHQTLDVVTVSIGATNVTLGWIDRVPAKSVWEDKNFLSAVVAGSCLAVIIALLLSVWACSFYLRYDDIVAASTKVSIQEIYHMAPPSMSIDQQLVGNGSYVLNDASADEFEDQRYSEHTETWNPPSSTRNSGVYNKGYYEIAL